jgi:hypothetical protein
MCHPEYVCAYSYVFTCIQVRCYEHLLCVGLCKSVCTLPNLHATLLLHIYPFTFRSSLSYCSLEWQFVSYIRGVGAFHRNLPQVTQIASGSRICGDFIVLNWTERLIKRASVQSNTPNDLQAAAPSADFDHKSPAASATNRRPVTSRSSTSSSA